MDKQDIIRMAREAGFNVDEKSQKYQPEFIFWCGYSCQKELFRFAALVAAAEREACAKVCDELVPDCSRDLASASVWDVATFDCAQAIRARGNT